MVPRREQGRALERERAGGSEWKWSGRTRGDNGLLRPGAARRIRAAATRGLHHVHTAFVFWRQSATERWFSSSVYHEAEPDRAFSRRSNS